MKNLPIEVSEDEIEDMFAAVDKNKDDKISYREFLFWTQTVVSTWPTPSFG